MKFEGKLSKCKEGSIMKECWKKWAAEGGMTTGMRGARMRMLEERECLRGMWKQAIESMEEPWTVLHEIGMEKEIEERK